MNLHSLSKWDILSHKWYCSCLYICRIIVYKLCNAYGIYLNQIRYTHIQVCNYGAHSMIYWTLRFSVFASQSVLYSTGATSSDTLVFVFWKNFVFTTYIYIYIYRYIWSHSFSSVLFRGNQFRKTLCVNSQMVFKQINNSWKFNPINAAYL